MTSVACRFPDEQPRRCLWELLASAVRREDDSEDERLPVDDSKRVYSPARGLAALERSVHACLALTSGPLSDFLERFCPQALEELRAESWFHGTSLLPVESRTEDVVGPAETFARVCAEAGGLVWQVRCVVVCPPRFNEVAEAADSKGAVLADGLGQLLRWNLATLPGDDGLTVFVDKHGGRNTYAAQLQHALPDSIVLARKESMARSVYELVGLRRELGLTFQPRADGEHFCVALASMTSKYLREVLMREFNQFWTDQVPGLKPTAGYPGDANRFLRSIRPALRRLQLHEELVWRKR